MQRLVEGIASGTLPADGAIGARLKAAEEELAALEVVPRAPTEAQEEDSAEALVRYGEMVAGLTHVAGARTGEIRDALREALGDVRIGTDRTGRPVARFGLQVSDGSGGVSWVSNTSELIDVELR